MAQKSFLTRGQLVESALQLFELLSRLAKLAFSRQPLVVREILCGFRDQLLIVGKNEDDFGGAVRRSPFLFPDADGASPLQGSHSEASLQSNHRACA